ncbi:hypothetical protein NEMBOFW57_009956 [Staphylotrichum longicolle]|uniref:Uncharacterized protein n=1 Tax=Staphylotrichum longicolle TaxID=669026 RepID=A0AAD4HTP2_9PEZI|nr:hypothetical protein NEMBOFW57_009956 [Staphylotrichum longicolle]
MTQRTIKQDAAGRRRKGSKVSQPPQENAEERSSQDTQAQDGPVQPLTDQFPTLVGFKADPPKDSSAGADPGPSFPDRPTEPFPPFSDSQAGLSSDGTQTEDKLATDFSHLSTNTQHDDDKNDSTANDATPAGTKATQPRRVKPTPVPAENHPSSSGTYQRAPSTRFEGGAPTPRNNDPAPSGPSTQQQEESGNLSKTIFARTGTAVEVPAARRLSEPPATGPASRAPTTKTGGSTWLSNDPTPPPEKVEEKGEKVIERKKSGKGKHGEKK